MQIEKLSEEQLRLLHQVPEEWTQIYLDTTPVDPSQIQEILGQLYALADKPAPKRIIHLDSPLQISRAVGDLRMNHETISQQVSRRVQEQVCRQLSLNQVIQTHQHPTYKSFAKQQKAYCLNRQGQERHYYPAEVMPTLLFEKISDVWEKVSERQLGHGVGFKATDLDLRYPFHDFGQFDQYLPWFDLHGRMGVDISKLTPRIELGKACGLGVLFWDWAFISAKPEYKVDGRGLLHCETGAAIRYPDGFSGFYLHGLHIPEKLVMSPETITISEIEAEHNVEIRRVMIERYGQVRYLMDSGAKEIHRDDFGILFSKYIPGDHPLVMVQVVNATPEPDGSFKEYFLRVPPWMQRARQAVAWTFGKEENDYAPAWQT